MNNANSDRIYNLLPAIYRLKDASEGEPLRALMAVIEREARAIESDIDGLYRNWFIETCEEWVVPYIGDLLGVKGLRSASQGSFSQRSFVANTMAYRRRKGTAVVLEQIARDVTGWPARAVEFFLLLATTQNLNHVRLDRPAAVDLRGGSQLDLIGGAFEAASHTADIRSLLDGGRYGIKNLGLFLWKLQSYAIQRGTARKMDDRHYWFGPLPRDIPLYNRPQTEIEMVNLAEEINVPAPLRRWLIHSDLEALRASLFNDGNRKSAYFGDTPVFQVFLDGEEVNSEHMIICNLEEWDLEYPCIATCQPGPETAKLAVDPELGRLAILGKDAAIPSEVLVSYSYGFSADIGGGPYNRRSSLESWLDLDERAPTWMMGVIGDEDEVDRDPDRLRKTLDEAVAEWNLFASISPDAFGIIVIMDNLSYNAMSVPAIEIPEGCRLAIVAASWPEILMQGNKIRGPEQIVPEDIRPHLIGSIAVVGKSSQESADQGEFIIDGMLIEGGIDVMPGNLGKIRLAHTTLVPDEGLLNVLASASGENSSLDVELFRCITGPLIIPPLGPTLKAAESIIDGSGGEALTASGASVSLEAVTVFGTVDVLSLNADNSILTGQVAAKRTQQGCVRFSYLPEGSTTPRRYCCQPEMALAGIDDPIKRYAIGSRVAPFFRSTTYGRPGYSQLSSAGAAEILEGAEDGSEMGALGILKGSLRISDLRTALDEYLRFGMDAGIFYED